MSKSNKKRDASTLEDKGQIDDKVTSCGQISRAIAGLKQKVADNEDLIRECEKKAKKLKDSNEMDNLIALFLAFFVCVKRDSKCSAVYNVPLYNTWSKHLLLLLDPNLDLRLTGLLANYTKHELGQSMSKFEERLFSFVSKEEIEGFASKIVMNMHHQNTVSKNPITRKVHFEMPYKTKKFDSLSMVILEQKIYKTSCEMECYFEDPQSSSPSGFYDNHRVLITYGIKRPDDA